MEGDERENVEARITCLRNIQTLMDAAVMQMQHYTQIAPLIRDIPKEKPSSRTTKQQDIDTLLKPTQKQSSDLLEGAVGYTPPPEVQQILDEESKTSQADKDELSEIRRRRLEKLETVKD